VFCYEIRVTISITLALNPSQAHSLNWSEKNVWCHFLHVSFRNPPFEPVKLTRGLIDLMVNLHISCMQMKKKCTRE